MILLNEKEINNTQYNIIFFVNDKNEIVKMNIANAFNKAFDHKLNLVQVDSKEGLPVCKMMNWGKVQYEQQKRKKQKVKKQKEITIKTNISDYDLERKSNSVSNFINKGHEVVVKIICHRNTQNKQDAFRKISEALPMTNPHSVSQVSNVRIIKFKQ